MVKPTRFRQPFRLTFSTDNGIEVIITGERVSNYSPGFSSAVFSDMSVLGDFPDAIIVKVPFCEAIPGFHERETLLAAFEILHRLGS